MIDITVKYPQLDNIFRIDVQSLVLNESKRKIFHKAVYVLIYLGKRVRFDVQMAVSFLAGRISIATEEDETKLFRVLRVLHNSMSEKMLFRGKQYVDESDKSTMDLRIWADSSWGCHDDGISRLAVIICVNDTCVEKEKNDHTTCYRGRTSIPNRCSSFRYMDNNVRGTHCATGKQ